MLKFIKRNKSKPKYLVESIFLEQCAIGLTEYELILDKFTVTNAIIDKAKISVADSSISYVSKNSIFIFGVLNENQLKYAFLKYISPNVYALKKINYKKAFCSISSVGEYLLAITPKIIIKKNASIVLKSTSILPVYKLKNFIFLEKKIFQPAHCKMEFRTIFSSSGLFCSKIAIAHISVGLSKEVYRRIRSFLIKNKIAEKLENFYINFKIQVLYLRIWARFTMKQLKELLDEYPWLYFLFASIFFLILSLLYVLYFGTNVKMLVMQTKIDKLFKEVYYLNRRLGYRIQKKIVAELALFTEESFNRVRHFASFSDNEWYEFLKNEIVLWLKARLSAQAKMLEEYGPTIAHLINKQNELYNLLCKKWGIVLE